MTTQWVAHLFSFFHAIYRPHHQPNHPPPRFHEGIEAEVVYDHSLHITVEHDENDSATDNSMKANSDTTSSSTKAAVSHFLQLPCAVFRPGMFLRARITAYDEAQGTYDLEYVDGPYLGNEVPDRTKALAVKDHPEAVFTVRHVKSAFLSVDMSDNYGSHFPFFLLAVSALQCFCFFYYVFNVSSAPLTGTSPVGGPHDWWMQVGKKKDAAVSLDRHICGN
jgi:hypothetical protein